MVCSEREEVGRMTETKRYFSEEDKKTFSKLPQWEKVGFVGRLMDVTTKIQMDQLISDIKERLKSK